MAVAAKELPPGRDFAGALSRPGLQVIAEIKRRSPSAGAIDPDLIPGLQAERYVQGGAAAISVLTEPDFFGGSISDLKDVRAVVDVPILRKDFIVDEAQIYESKVAGADAVLLIVAALSAAQLTGLMATATMVGLATLVEAHNSDEVAIANHSGAQVVGINNRNLRTFVTDLTTAEQLGPTIAAPVRVAESGVSSVAGARRMAAAGFDAILVGEALVRSDDPAKLVAQLREAR